jgi:hypothetical protein
LVYACSPAVCPSRAAAAKPSRRKGLDTSGSRPGSKQSSNKGKPKQRDSMDDFIVDDSDSSGKEGRDYDEDESGGLLNTQNMLTSME